MAIVAVVAPKGARGYKIEEGAVAVGHIRQPAVPQPVVKDDGVACAREDGARGPVAPFGELAPTHVATGRKLGGTAAEGANRPVSPSSA